MKDEIASWSFSAALRMEEREMPERSCDGEFGVYLRSMFLTYPFNVLFAYPLVLPLVTRLL